MKFAISLLLIAFSPMTTFADVLMSPGRVIAGPDILLMNSNLPMISAVNVPTTLDTGAGTVTHHPFTTRLSDTTTFSRSYVYEGTPICDLNGCVIPPPDVYTISVTVNPLDATLTTPIVSPLTQVTPLHAFFNPTTFGPEFSMTTHLSGTWTATGPTESDSGSFNVPVFTSITAHNGGALTLVRSEPNGPVTGYSPTDIRIAYDSTFSAVLASTTVDGKSFLVTAIPEPSAFLYAALVAIGVVAFRANTSH